MTFLKETTWAGRVLAIARHMAQRAKKMAEAAFVSSLQFILPAEAALLMMMVPRRVALPLLIVSAFGLLAMLPTPLPTLKRQREED